MAYAEFAFEATSPREDGSTLAEHWKAALERGADPETIPQPPPFPETFRFVWETYQQLSAARQVTGFGVGPISFTDMDAWERVTQMKLSLFDVELLQQIDNAFFSVRAKNKTNKKGH